jgi:hypothetical protein
MLGGAVDALYWPSARNMKSRASVEIHHRGYCLMIDGEAKVVARLRPLLEVIAPGVETASRTPGRTGAAGRRRTRLSALEPIGG